MFQGRSAVAWRRYRQAEEVATSIGDRRLAARGQHDMGNLLLERGALDRAARYFAAALAVYQDLGDLVGEGVCYAGLGLLHKQHGQYTEAEAWFERSWRAYERANNRMGIAESLNSIGEMARFQGDLPRAEAYYRKSLSMFLALATVEGAIPEHNLGLVLVEQGRMEEARGVLEGSVRKFELQGRHGIVGAALSGLLPVLASAGAWEELDATLDRARRLLTETVVVDVDIARLAHLAGDLAAAAGQGARARECWALARAQWTALGNNAEIERLNTQIGEIEAR